VYTRAADTIRRSWREETCDCQKQDRSWSGCRTSLPDHPERAEKVQAQNKQVGQVLQTIRSEEQCTTIRRLTALFKVHEQQSAQNDKTYGDVSARVSKTLLILTPKGVTDCFKDMASSVLVGLHADFASPSAEIVHAAASCMHDLRDTKSRKNSARTVCDTVSSSSSFVFLQSFVVLL
jgi:hypothetical protein